MNHPFAPDRMEDELFRLAFEQAAVGIALILPGGRFLRANTAFCDFVGYSEQELQAADFKSTAHHHRVHNDLMFIADALDSGIGGFRMEKRYLRRDGAVLWAALSVSQTDSEAGGPNYFIVVLQDISERRRAEESLRESEARFRLLADNATDLVCLHEPGGRFQYVSPSVRRLLGYEPLELLGSNLYPLIHPDDVEPVRMELRHQALEGNVTLVVEYRIRRKAGEYIWFETMFQPVTGPSGKTGEIQSTSRDISDRVTAQQEFARAHARYITICDSVSDLISVHDRKGVYLFAGPSSQALLGYPPDELTGLNAFASVHPDDRTLVLNAYRKLRETGGNVKVRYRSRRKDGSYVWLETYSQLIPGLYGGENEVISVSHDAREEHIHAALLEQRKRAEERSHLLHELEMRDELTNIFNRRAVHEVLRTTLSSRRASSYPLGCLVVDIDYFKSVNETFGRGIGDMVLKRVAQVLADCSRGSDYVARYGGDRFVLLLPNTGPAGTVVTGERIIQRARGAVWPDLPEGTRITVSVGGTCLLMGANAAPSHIVEMASAQVRKAKQLGRDRMVMDSREQVRTRSEEFPPLLERPF